MHNHYAIFISYPRTIEDLKTPLIADKEKPFIIEKTIELKKLDYSNFITDLCADRWFIEENARLCRIDEKGIWHCILVKQKSKNEGILVMSGGAIFPKFAAYYVIE